MKKDEQCNILGSLADAERRYCREVIISAVLATDISQHFALLGQMKSTILSSFNSNKKEDVFLMLKLIIKCADISNPAKHIDIARLWAERVCEEFYSQGDKERALGLSISPLCDRSKPAMAKSQIGFIQYICKPLFEALVKFEPSLEFTIETISSNFAYWDKKRAEEENAAAQ